MPIALDETHRINLSTRVGNREAGQAGGGSRGRSDAGFGERRRTEDRHRPGCYSARTGGRDYQRLPSDSSNDSLHIAESCH